MRFTVPLTLAALGLLAVPLFSNISRGSEGAQVGQQIPKFSTPTFGFLDSSKQTSTTCYLFVGVKCGATPGYVERFKALEAEFCAKGVDFVFVYPNKTETLDEKLAFHEKGGFHSVLAEDEGAKFAKSLGIVQTATAVLVDGKGKILYNGGIDDSRDAKSVQHRWVAEALNETLAGKSVTTTTSKAFG